MRSEKSLANPEIGEIEAKVRAAIGDSDALPPEKQVVAGLAVHLAKALDDGARSQTALVARQLREAMAELLADSSADVEAATGLILMPLDLLRYAPAAWPTFEAWHAARLAWCHEHPNGRPDALEVIREDYRHPDNPAASVTP